MPLDVPTVGSGGEIRVDDDVRRSQIRWLRRQNGFIDIFSQIDPLIAKANEDFFWVDYEYLPAIQFTEYDSAYQGHYIRHMDTFLTSPTFTHRKISFSVQLSDPNSYEGGDFQFSEPGVHPDPEAIRQQGTLIIFPGIIFHNVTPVTKGIRYSLVGWYEGPRWR